MKPNINIPKPPKTKCNKKLIDFMRKNRLMHKNENEIKDQNN